MNEDDSERIDSNFADLILILQSVWDDGDKLWEKEKTDWLLDDSGNKIYL